MDTSSFDRITRLLGAGATRRAGLGLAAAALLGSTAAAAPKPAGPCKGTKRPDNICSKNGDCCTGICNTKAGKKNKDGKGRCRCVNRGGACTASKNCCSRRGQQMTCNDGICGNPEPEPICVPLQGVCVPQVDTCCGGECSTQLVPASTQPLAPAQTVCCIAEDASGCTVPADCCILDSVCNDGVCQQRG
jgi:hypothetical protein